MFSGFAVAFGSPEPRSYGQPDPFNVPQDMRRLIKDCLLLCFPIELESFTEVQRQVVTSWTMSPEQILRSLHSVQPIFALTISWAVGIKFREPFSIALVHSIYNRAFLPSRFLIASSA
jgi:hypothetical protein